MNLLMHCGASKATWEDVMEAPTPEATPSWTPVPHSALVHLVRDQLRSEGIQIGHEAHALSHAGDRYFGLYELGFGEDPSIRHVMGIRNSHDKTFSAGLVFGSQVLVCDNLAFAGEVMLSRRHVYDVLSSIQYRLLRVIPCVKNSALGIERTYDRYRERRIHNVDVSVLTIGAVDAGILTGSQVPKVLKEYREPRHEDFSQRTLWSWFNAVTEVAKGASLPTLSQRTQRLHELCNKFI